MPKIWGQIFILRLVDLAKESTITRLVLDPLLIYFDNGRHWGPNNCLALNVLSDMSYFMESPGNQQSILAGVVRHLDHKNIVLFSGISRGTSCSTFESHVAFGCGNTCRRASNILYSSHSEFYPHKKWYFNHPRRWQSKNASTFTSITSLLKRLRGEKYGTKVNQGSETDDFKNLDEVDEEWKHGWTHKDSPNIHIFSILFDRANRPASFLQTEQSFLRCNEEQIAQLLSALWIQLNLLNNLPANVEAIAKSFYLILVSSYVKSSNNTLVLRFFQLPMSLRKLVLDSNNGSLSPACQRLLLVLSTAMLMFAAKLYHIADSHDLFNMSLESDIDPFIGISDDCQVYLKPHVEVKDCGSTSYNDDASSVLTKLRDRAYESEKLVYGMLLESLSSITKFGAEDIANQLSEEFVPEEVFIFGHNSILEIDYIQTAAHSKRSPSYDGEFSANSLVYDDAVSMSSVADISRFVPKAPPSASPSMSHIVGKLLESVITY